MGKRGPKTQPDNVRELHSGTKNKHRKVNPAVPPVSDVGGGEGPLAPDTLSAGAQAHWDSLAPTLAAHGLLTAWDLVAFEQYCHLAAARDKLQAKINARPGGILDATNREFVRLRSLDMSLLRYSARFGLTPADRQQIKVDRPTPKNTERLLS